MTAAVTKFERLAGQMPLGQATPEVVQAFVDGLRREGKSEYMVLRYVGAMKAVTQLLGTFEQCGDEGNNPFAEAADVLRAAAPYTYRTQVAPFALDKLQTLLSSPQYLAKESAVEPHRAAQFWVPLLCLFTHARPKELIRLQVSDLERHKDAWVLRVSSTMQLDPRTGAAAMRWVPLNEELVRCGFVSYVAQRKLNGHVDLFDLGSMGETLSARAHRLSHWFSGLGRTLGLGEGCNLFALRRAFIAACIRSGITDEGIRLLAGRTVEVPSTFQPVQLPLSYTDALDQAVTWLRRLRFGGLELSHLHALDPLASVPDAYPDSANA
jgi:integrase